MHWIWLFLTVLLTVSTSNADLFDDPCRSYSGENGTCKKLEDCQSALDQVKQNRRHDKKRCGFVGTTEVVCCTDIPGTAEATDDGDGGSVWETDDPGAASPATAKVPTAGERDGLSATPNPTVSRKGQRKSEIACEDYSNEVNLTIAFHILGGEAALIGEFPHMAALGYLTDDGMSWQCGGSLISDQYVLTAAHCIINPDRLRPTKVRLGMITLDGSPSGDSTDPPPQEYAIEDIKVNRDFIRRTSANDIALLRLEKKVTYTQNVQPACLYGKPDDPVGLLVTGWGYIDNQASERSNVLQKAMLSAVPITKCNTTYVKRQRVLTTNQMCAGSHDGMQDSCRGDSGGPLQIFKDKVYAIVGIISYGIGCGGTVPAVYTRVASYLDWIEPIVWPDA